MYCAIYRDTSRPPLAARAFAVGQQSSRRAGSVCVRAWVRACVSECGCGNQYSTVESSRSGPMRRMLPAAGEYGSETRCPALPMQTPCSRNSCPHSQQGRHTAIHTTVINKSILQCPVTSPFFFNPKSNVLLPQRDSRRGGASRSPSHNM